MAKRPLHLLILLAALAIVLSSGQSLSAAGYADLIQSKSPVAYFRLNEPSGATTAIDSAGGNNGTFNNFAPGNFQQPGATPLNNSDPSLFFDQVSNTSGSYIQGNLPASTFAGDWTITGWFNRSSQTTWGSIFSGSVGTNSTPIMTWRNNTDQFGLMNAGVSETQAVYVDLGGAGYQNGDWVFAAITKTGANTSGSWTANVYAYLDDGTVLQNSGNPAFNINPSSSYYIGRHWVNGLYFDGLIDEVAIFDRALSAAELNELFAEANTTPLSPEPSTFLLCGLLFGGGALCYWMRKRNQLAN